MMYRIMSVMTLALALFVTSAVEAQIIPTTYRMTRTAAGQPANVFEFPKANMQCALPRGPFAGPAIRVDDPANGTLDCQYDGPGNWSNLLPGVEYTFAIQGCVLSTTGQTVCGPSASASTGVPGAPGGFRISPGFTGVSVVGQVNDRFPFAGLDVFRADLNQFGPGFALYVGAPTLTTPTYAVQRGDRFSLVLWREQP